MAGLISERINPAFESMFAVGVDEMSWDDLNDANYDWPTSTEVKHYRQQVRDAVVARVPLKVASPAEDIANLVCFLASPASSNMTGEFVRMDAGMHLIQ